MKFITQLALAASILVAPAAHAYTLPEHVIAELSSTGGFVPQTFPALSGVRVFDDGRVEHFEIFRNGREINQAIANLAETRVDAIKKAVKTFADVKLKKEDPRGVMCSDAPTTTVLALNGKGQAVALEGRTGCLRMIRADNKQSQLPQLLQALDALNSL